MRAANLRLPAIGDNCIDADAETPGRFSTTSGLLPWGAPFPVFWRLLPTFVPLDSSKVQMQAVIVFERGGGVD